MATTSFGLPNQTIGLPNQTIGPRFSVNPPPHRQSLRVSASAATAVRTENVSLYEVLGIETGASSQEIKSAYRRLARVLHPDAAASGCGNDDASSSGDEFMRLHAAYATLSDPEKRAVYDSSLFPRRRRSATLSTGSYPSGAAWRRNWETDQCW